MSISKTGSPSEQKSVLQQYYANYLRDVRGLSESSVRHYFDALNNISRRLIEKGLVRHSIYEISDLDELLAIKDELFSDSDFRSQNDRGNQMYSAGLNNYCRFAAGEEFHKAQKKLDVLDIPIAAPAAGTVIEKTQAKRSDILRIQAIEMADYLCEINSSHQTFISAKTNKPYMEGHHALPLSLQNRFKVSIDVYANIICLCPICHRKIHYGLRDDRATMTKQLYENRSKRLANCGIELSQTDFVEMAIEI